MKKAVLLVNLGSPASPDVAAVRTYLREFLMDPRVLDVNWFLRFCIVHLAILPSRPKQSAHAYKSIWTAEGSPLIVISQRVRARLQERVNVPVELAMRYQEPSIPGAIQSLAAKGVEEVLVFPLFPHYAMSSYETAVERVKQVAAKHAPGMKLSVQPPYYEEPDYIAALVGSASEYLQKNLDHVLISFHGVPERHIHKSDTTGCHCLKVNDCCNVASPAHATCYRAQCFKTATAFARLAGLPSDKYSVSFQSRLGRDPWLQPYTEQRLVELAGRGVRRLAVLCPAFVSDCLETIEEIGMRGREVFLKAGGAEFIRIPCLNEHPLWLEMLERRVSDFCAGSSSAFGVQPSGCLSPKTR